MRSPRALRALVVIVIAANPYSGAGPNRRRVEALAAALRAAGEKPRLVWDPAARAVLLADAGAMGECRGVVAAGGDGTIAQVINELPPDVPLAVLPIGTENVFARALGLGREPEALAAAIAANRTRVIDLGCAIAPGRGRRRFALMLSVGFDAHVVHRLARWRTAGPTLRRVRRASYLRPIAASLIDYGWDPIEVEVNGALARGAHCVVSNLPDYAVSLKITPDARPDDGWLDWVLFQRPGALALARYSWAAWRASHLARPDVTAGRTARLRIASVRPLPVQLDGDPWGFTPVDVEVAAGALTVVLSPPDP